MAGLETQIVINGAVSLAVAGAVALMKKLNFSKIHAIVMPIGKSTLCSRLSNSDTFFIDIDELGRNNVGDKYDEYVKSESQFIMNVYPAIAKHIEDMVKQFSKLNKRVVLVSGNIELIEMLGVSKKHIRVYLPDNELLSRLPLQEQDRFALEKSKLLLASRSDVKYYVMSSFNEMYQKVREKLRLKLSLNM